MRLMSPPDVPTMDRLESEQPAVPFRRFIAALGVVGLLVTIDLTIKWIMINVVMNPPQVIPVFPYFNLVLGFNRGVSFGLLSNLGTWAPVILSVLALGIIAVLMVWLYRVRHHGELVGLVLIIGGAIGNLIDRLHDGAVTDYLDFYARQYHWPAFNLADIFIVTGMVSLLIFGRDSISYGRHTDQDDQ